MEHITYGTEIGGFVQSGGEKTEKIYYCYLPGRHSENVASSQRWAMEGQEATGMI